MGFFTINKRLLPPKAHYFLYFGGMASFWPFITVFAKQLGVTELPVGILFTLAPVTGLISMPLFGALADRFKIKKKLFLFFNFLNFFAILAFAFLPKAGNLERNVALTCGFGTSHIVQNRSGFTLEDFSKNQANLKLKCVDLEVDEFSHHIQLLDDCRLSCTVSEEERASLCSLYLGVHKPYYCGDSEFSPSDRLDFKISVKTWDAFVEHENLYIPIHQVVDEEGFAERYSCDEPTAFQNCSIDCYTNPVLDFKLQRIPDQENVYVSSVFWSYVFLVLVTWIAFAVVTSIADALCFQTLGDQPHLYGVQRQWGAMGWGLFSLLSGSLVDFQSQGSLLKDYTPCFYLVGFMLMLNFFVCLNWNVKEEEKPHALGKSIFELVTNPKISVFILACVVVGVCTGLLWQFLFWYAEDIASCEDMQYIKILQGLISIVQCFGGELPFFYISSWFIKSFGHVNCMTLVLGAFGLRFILYSLLTNPWTILPVELLQGVTYGIFYSNMASYAYVVSPPGSAATVQGIVGAAFEGIGVGLGSLIGGLLYKNISGRLTFRAFGIFTLGFCLIHHLSMKVIAKRFTPVNQNDTTEGYRNGHSKLQEMKEMNGTVFSASSDSE